MRLSLPTSVTIDALVLPTLVAVATVVGLLLYVQREELTRKCVFAWLPWFGTGAALHALRGSIGYPDLAWPLLQVPWVYVFVGTIAGILWTLFVQLSTSDRGRMAASHYFGLMGLGTLLPPVVHLIIQHGIASPRMLILWVTVPVMAVVITYCLVLCMGVWLPNPTYFAGFAGSILLFAVAVEAITTALALGLGSHVASPFFLRVTTHLVDVTGLAAPLVVVGLLVWLRLAVALALLVGLELLERSHPVLAERSLKLATVGTLVLSVNTFMLALAGGWFA